MLLNNYYIYRYGSDQSDDWKSISDATMTIPITRTYADSNSRIETTTTRHQPSKTVFDSKLQPIPYISSHIARK